MIEKTRRIRFGPTTAEKLKLPQGATQVDYWDLLMPRFGVRVGKRRRVWMIRYSMSGEKRREIIGRVGRMLLTEARKRADIRLARVDEGLDPRIEAPLDLKALTFDQLVEEYKKRHGQNKRSWESDWGRIRRDLSPAFGSKLATAITDADIQAVIDKMSGRGVTVGASRTFETARAIFNWAVKKKLIPRSPADGMEAPFKTGRRDRFLTDDELKRFWDHLELGDPRNRVVTAVLRVMLLTGQRHGEIRRMQWSDLDLAGGWWNAPATRTKTGKPYRVCLTSRARAEIEAMRARSEFWVFPARNGKNGLSPFDLNDFVQALRTDAKIADFVPHDLRHTVATNLAAMGVREEIIARILNHAPPFAMTARYNEHRYDAEKRTALDDWERRLLKIAGKCSISKSAGGETLP